LGNQKLSLDLGIHLSFVIPFLVSRVWFLVSRSLTADPAVQQAPGSVP